MPDSMYSDIILEYYRHPVNFGKLEPCDIHFHDTNPLCGDDLDIFITLDGNKVREIKFSGKGCAISQASASMLTETVDGKTLDDIKKMSKQDILDMLKIPISHTRIKCALLSLKVLKLGVYKHLGEKISDEDRKL
ncbi:MAG: SUF system NifU family Fe-S cluster assembly protein [Candidatus Aenigmarchaeota archaeon]|nr:SUF system NifU family Fe-S cluster assembly protein [Candidatus Aenigmarchaeota archaeon]